MSEKRKPIFVFLSKKMRQGEIVKTNKIEVYNASDFKGRYSVVVNNSSANIESTYRIRVNGRFWPPGKRVVFWKSEIMKLIAKSITFE